jgi:hypothetical protein
MVNAMAFGVGERHGVKPTQPPFVAPPDIKIRWGFTAGMIKIS